MQRHRLQMQAGICGRLLADKGSRLLSDSCNQLMHKTQTDVNAGLEI